MATGGLNPTAQVLDTDFIVVAWQNIDYPNDYTDVIKKIIDQCGGLAKASRTTVLLLRGSTGGNPDISPAAWAYDSILLVPKVTTAGNNIKSLFVNSSIERFYSEGATYQQSQGVNCRFTIDKVPDFDFIGVHLKDNPISFVNSVNRSLDDPNPIGTRYSLYESSIWNTFVANGIVEANNLPPPAPSINPGSYYDVIVINAFFAKYADKGLISNCKLSFYPNAAQISDISVGATALANLTDVQLSDLPLTTTNTRLSYNPASSLWENKAVLQLHEWKYELGYTTPAEGVFKFNNNTIVIATKLAINDFSMAKYPDVAWLEGAVEPARKNLLKIEFNTFAIIFRVTAYADLGTYVELDINLFDIWGFSIVPEDVCQFSIVPENAILGAVNTGSGTAIYTGIYNREALLRSVIAGSGIGVGTTGEDDEMVQIYLNAGLYNLNDVDMSVPPTTNQVLQWNGTDWVPSTIGGSSSNNFTSLVDPTVTDDSSGGYSVGSQWLNTTRNQLWFCADATVGVAVWRVSTTDYSSQSVRVNSTAVLNNGSTHAVALGSGATIVSGNSGVSIGHDSQTTGATNVAIGRLANAGAVDCVSVGASSSCTTRNGTAIGCSAASTGRGYIALGSGATTTAASRLALGFDGQNNVNTTGVFARLPVDIDGVARNLLMRDTDLSLDNLTDVVITAPTTGDRLLYDGTNFINNKPDFWLTGSRYPAGISATANITQTTWYTFMVDNTMTITKCAMYIVAGGTGNVKCAIYLGRPDGGAATTLVSETATVNPHTALTEQEYTFPAPVTLTKGVQYSMAISQVLNTTLGLHGGVVNISLGRYNTTNYTVTGFPANLGAVSFTGTSTSRFVMCLR